ncbi:hypothetical protein ABB37_01666 [Leptomonas pyrrhocoris]|uniref:Uncharacterized protein n=1 Tax=Leptomonas pyrrhocoris TaxID=157538 RepID=A0A0M9G930_LEPPY|nr:hypothetical protein ABB37_01666 [Leptomonas pyrrhocoris]KPA85340.1 hypothetical protein ABB37_01666 [Leptomonas pyrrhocoris]|eukprot:XP_015663779.1 hypothetical protein ABB37_01666 [Leptomonas pyrrhocoris]
MVQQQSTVFDGEERHEGVPAPFFNPIPLRYREEKRYQLLPDEEKFSDLITSPIDGVSTRKMAETMDFSIFDKVEAMMTIPNINSYDLHAVDSITDDMVSSLKGRRMMYRFIPTEGRHVIRRAILLQQNEHKSRVFGASLYMRIVHPFDVAARASSTVSRPSQITNAPPQQNYKQEVKQIRDKIERVLRRYVNRLIEPFPNELAIDLTHYRTFLALLVVSRRNVEQFKKDAADYIAQRPVNPEGIPAGPPPPEDLEPVSVDVLAAEIARLIRRDVLQPLYSGTDPANSQLNGDRADVATASSNIPRVCIGVASSPVLAKIACDAEVTVIMKKLEDLAAREQGAASTTTGAEKVSLISVRSLHRHTSSLKAVRKLLADFPVSQIPLFSPSFVKLLREAFDIRTCEDLYVQQNVLCFCLSPNTFRVCYSVACGCMSFPIEDTVALVAMSNLYNSCSALRVLSSNVMSIVNAERTKFAVAIDNITRDTFSFRIRQPRFSNIGYGRLTSDADLVQSVLDLVDRNYLKVHRNGETFGGLHCAISEGLVTKYSFDITFTPFLPLEEVRKAVKAQIGPLLQHRKRDGIDAEGLFCTFTIAYTQLVPIPMVPPAMMEEAEGLKEAVMHVKYQIFRCKWVKEERKQAKKVINEPREVPALPETGASKPPKKSPSEPRVDDVFLV